VSPIGRNKEEWFVQRPIIGGLNLPLLIVSPYRAHIRSAHARLHPLRRLRGIFLMGAATPPFQGGEYALPVTILTFRTLTMLGTKSEIRDVNSNSLVPQ